MVDNGFRGSTAPTASPPSDTFYGFGEPQQHKTQFTYEVDHPLVFAAEDNGATPGRIRAGGPRRLPVRRYRIDRPTARHPATVGARNCRGRTRPARNRWC